jgi:acetyl-CoA carboxylase beta subunit
MCQTTSQIDAEMVACDECGRDFSEDQINAETMLCKACHHKHYTTCNDCTGLFERCDLDKDDVCQDCRGALKAETKDLLDTLKDAEREAAAVAAAIKFLKAKGYKVTEG